MDTSEGVDDPGVEFEGVVSKPISILASLRKKEQDQQEKYARTSEESVDTPIRTIPTTERAVRAHTLQFATPRAHLEGFTLKWTNLWDVGELFFLAKIPAFGSDVGSLQSKSVSNPEIEDQPKHTPIIPPRLTGELPGKLAGACALKPEKASLDELSKEVRDDALTLATSTSLDSNAPRFILHSPAHAGT
ncbi:hypothetical protein B0H11DRAFT_2220146 [Mycena galericulata]|nr:hypothetical protein B0H11DRAFT_2220146 [Mycena galericulata]